MRILTWTTVLAALLVIVGCGKCKHKYGLYEEVDLSGNYSLVSEHTELRKCRERATLLMGLWEYPILHRHVCRSFPS
ncbi:MAG TPA: hypothetical protein PKK10_11620 [Woeseiaceae bacterium]|nr:hypothetical protein [Woeseiaceae bacterium]